MSFSTHSKGNSYRDEIGKYVNESLVLGFANNDLEKFDGDVAEALNGAVGTAKKVTIKCKILFFFFFVFLDLNYCCVSGCEGWYL